MNKTQLKALMSAAARPTAGVNFNDAQSAAKNAMIEYFNLKDATVRDLQYRPEIFAMINEVVDEIVPKAVEDRVGDFSEVRTFERDADIYFNIKTTHASRRRLYKTIRKGARGGMYKAHRVDGTHMHITAEVESVGYQITLEELLLGTRTVSELVGILAEAWIEKMYIEVMETLMAAKTLAPAANVKTGTGGAITNTDLDEIIAIVNTYGKPTIFGFRQELSLISNGIGAGLNPNLPTSDLDEIKRQGFVGMYKGIGLVELPNYLLDMQNTQWLFTNNDLLIIPAAEKPVKIAFKGESYTAQVDQPHGGKEWHNHRIMGVNVLFYNNIGVYTVTY